MSDNSRLICFIATTNAEAAQQFYRDVLAFQLVEDGTHALVFDVNGTMLRIQKVVELAPSPATALGLDVSDIRSKISELMGRGVAFNRYAGMNQDELGIWTAPGGARVAWFTDPDGNNLSLTQF
jgi:catechol 2,3-dioxygenase-like lactoylglutathione lyase family enzyme